MLTTRQRLGHVAAVTMVRASRLEHSRMILSTWNGKSLLNFRRSSAVTSMPATTTMTIPTSKAVSSTINLAARTWKYFKMVALMAGVYSLGFQQGTIEYSRDPQKRQQILWESMVVQHKFTSRDSIQRFENGFEDQKMRAQVMKDHPQLKLVVSVGERIITSAKTHIHSQVKAIADTPRVTDAQMSSWPNAFVELDDLRRWARADRTMNYGPWTYTIIPSNIPKLSMSEILPRHVFVSTALLDKVENEEELAFMMAIEMSHLLLGHNTIQNLIETGLRTIQVLFLSIDPTEGILSFAVVATLEWLREFAMKSGVNSWHQDEADTLGMTLAAMACFDTMLALKVINKFPHDRPKLRIGASSGADDRYLRLQKLAETECIQKYDRCIKVRKRLFGLF